MTSLAFILGVVPLVVASGAGWEVRRALGVAVFSGMLGVTFFGVLLTPVFFFALGWLGGTPLLRMRAVRWTLSLLGGLAIGSAVAVMLAWLHVPAFVAWPLGVGLGLGTAAVVTVRRR
jgi:multidrug efflux pump